MQSENDLKKRKKNFTMARKYQVIRERQSLRSPKNAKNVACVVQLISSVYIEVSNTYLLAGVNGFQIIALLEPRSDHARMEEVWNELQEYAKEAEKGIPIIAEEKKVCIKENYEVKIFNRYKNSPLI